MASGIVDVTFIVWGFDQAAYGPVELPTLVSWIKDERVTAETWIFANAANTWQRADAMPELQMFFHGKSNRVPGSNALGGPLPEGPTGVDPRALRRIKILASFNDEQLARFARFTEVQKVPQWAVIVKQGDPGDSMFFILEGELRIRINIGGRETILATMTAGEFFGDISLFDHGPRSADVVANTDSVVVRFTSAGFDELAREAPDLATPFLRAIGKTLTARIRADNKRFGDSVRFSQASHEV